MTPKARRVLADICQRHHIEIDVLRSRSREPWVMTLRREAVERLTTEARLTSKQVAAILGFKARNMRHHARAARLRNRGA